ncbi:MAG: hypothetical protein M1822_006964 [Bathelium mastoideum]|nr:MAG: hypothetical protein M1822_006964 [Bathelium mastoideum]
MNADGQELVWVGQSNPRAPRLPQKSWDNYKQELRRLYEMMTLDDLMSFMSLRYDFRPTRRQYVYQFHKWGFTKHGSEIHTEAAEQMNPEFIKTPLKRSPPVTVRSESSKPDIHTTKRQQILPPIEFKDPLHGLGLPFDTFAADEHHLLFSQSDHYRAPAVGDFEEWAKGQRRLNDPDAESLQIDPSQDIHDFSNESIYEMKRAADFLAATSCREDAFTLYVNITNLPRLDDNVDYHYLLSYGLD